MKAHRVRHKFKVISATLLLLIIFATTFAYSQNQLPGVIRIGVRTAADSIGNVYIEAGKKRFGGYCKFFGQELEHEFQNRDLSIKVSYTDILNEYKGRKYPRYDGLKLKNSSSGKSSRIDIECGPNSRPVNELDWNNWKHVLFSETFHKVNIKLLLREKLFNELTNTPSDQLKQKLKSIKIGVSKNSVTIGKLINASYDYLGFETKEGAIEALQKGDVDAYANDSPMLETLINRDFNKKGYLIFPKYGTLPDLQQDEYVIAISKDTDFSGQLLSIVNDVIKHPQLTDYAKQLEKNDSGNKHLSQKTHSSNRNNSFQMLIVGFTLGATVIAIPLVFLFPDLRRKLAAILVMSIGSAFNRLLSMAVDILRRNI